jgi:hypothetical protein
MGVKVTNREEWIGKKHNVENKGCTKMKLDTTAL